MQNLYDLLGVRPEDDAETLKKAFREAAKATHPDHHGDDPQAAVRFRRISQAYDILRDAGQRAAYDRLLEFERRPLHREVKRSWAGVKRHVVQDLMAGVLLAAALAGGYELFVRAPETSGAAATTAHASRQATADHPAGRIMAGHDRPERVPAPQMPITVPTAPVAASAANDHERPAMTDGEPASDPAGQTAAAADHHDRPEMNDDERAANAARQTVGVATRDNERTEGQPIAQHNTPSLNDPISSPGEAHDTIPAAGGKPESAGPAGANTGGANTGGAKPLEKKTPSQSAVKRHAPSHQPVEHAALENRNAPAADTRNVIYGAGF